MTTVKLDRLATLISELADMMAKAIPQRAKKAADQPKMLQAKSGAARTESYNELRTD